MVMRGVRIWLPALILCLVFCAATVLAARSAPSEERATRRVSIEAKNEPLQNVLLRLAREARTSISVAPNVQGYVNVALHNVTVPEALDAILTPLGEAYRKRGEFYIVEPARKVSRTAMQGLEGTNPISQAVLPLTVIPSARAARQLQTLFPQATIRTDSSANAIVVTARSSDLQEIRSVLQGLDTQDPTRVTTEVLTLHRMRAADLFGQLKSTFPAARFATVGRSQILVSAKPAELAQVKSAVSALDAPEATPPPTALSSEAVRVTQRPPRDVARSLERQVPSLRAAVSGSAVVLSGPPDAVARGKALVAQIDVPPFEARYTVIYRIRSVDASSVAGLLRRSFREIDVTVDSGINAVAVTGTVGQQQRIADAISELDPAPGTSTGVPGTPTFAPGSNVDVVTLKSYVPAQSGGADAVTSITQALQVIAPDVHVIQLPTPGQIALAGPPPSVRTAEDFIAKVDVVPPLVILDTEVLELDESVAKNIGVQLGTAVLSTTFTEGTPAPNASGGIPPLGAIQPFGRTPLSFTAQLNLALSNGKGRVLADPRITTLSGRTASIRAGDTISILTTTAGNAGTIASTQVQSFQTGVNLDITPSVTPDGGVTVALHPVVNSLAGTNNGVPEISTRDTQTTVHLQDDQTLVIGGLIQENDTRTTTKIPVLGDIPFVGKLFTNDQVNNTRNELVIVVTPHIVKPGSTYQPGPPLHAVPPMESLPTLPPNTVVPPPRSTPARIASNESISAPTTLSSAMPSAHTATPGPTPAAFAQTNVFSFGAAPQSNFAKPTDTVQIFYATLSPTVVSNGTSVRVAAITTTNAASCKITIGTTTISLGQAGPGQWQGVFPFPAGTLSAGQNSVTVSLVAARSDGASATVPILLNVTP